MQLSAAIDAITASFQVMQSAVDALSQDETIRSLPSENRFDDGRKKVLGLGAILKKWNDLADKSKGSYILAEIGPNADEIRERVLGDAKQLLLEAEAEGRPTEAIERAIGVLETYLASPALDTVKGLARSDRRLT